MIFNVPLMMLFCVINGMFYGIESGITSWVTCAAEAGIFKLIMPAA